jgi:hypothetical protein
MVVQRLTFIALACCLTAPTRADDNLVGNEAVEAQPARVAVLPSPSEPIRKDAVSAAAPDAAAAIDVGDQFERSNESDLQKWWRYYLRMLERAE